MSDVLIKNIQIPRDNKRLALFIDKDGEVTVFEGSEFNRITDAIEVPTHGRLGDLDSIECKIKGKIDDVPKGKDGTRTVKQAFYANGLLRAKELVGHEPTVIPASRGERND